MRNVIVSILSFVGLCLILRSLLTAIPAIRAKRQRRRREKETET